MTASALAGECGLPLMFVQLHSLNPEVLGETAAKLHLVFDAMSQTPGVYLFDEFDATRCHAINTQRVGEIRRVLNSSSAIHGTRRLRQHHRRRHKSGGDADPALFRRFERSSPTIGQRQTW
jgi:hypothetical protein